MNITFSPSLGWIAGSILAVMMLILASYEVLQYRRRLHSDETYSSCIRRSALCLLIAVMALTPSQLSVISHRIVNATDIVLAVDVTNSMAVEDAQYGSNKRISRLQAVQQAIGDVTTNYPQASFAAVSFDANATLDVPLTPDVRAITGWAQSLRVRTTSSATGSQLDTPINRLLLTLSSIRKQHPNHALILYVFSDGEQTSTQSRRSYSSLRRYIDDAFSIGVGSTQGGHIPQVDDTAIAGLPHKQRSSQSPSWVIDPETGKPGISRIDANNLEHIADELGGTAIFLNETNTLTHHASKHQSTTTTVLDTPKQRERSQAIVWPCALVIVILLAWELGAWLNTTRRLL